MFTEILGIIFMFALTLILAYPLGRYMASIYKGEPHWSDKVFGGVERVIFRIIGQDGRCGMSWQEQVVAMLVINGIWLVITLLVLLNMRWLPLNPDGNPSMSLDLAVNTAISFLVNCNLQHYSGESGLSYLGQMALMFLQFVSAATGLAAGAMTFSALREGKQGHPGNFYDFFVKSCTRVLFPLAVVIAVVLAFNGTPMTWEGKDTMITMEGDTVEVSRGPVAAFVAIKHLGTNGGGFYGVNSAHPLENPNYLTNAVEMVAQMIIPFAFIFALGFFLKRRRLAWAVFGTMTAGFLLLVVPAILAELGGNPNLEEMCISAGGGAMEGKEVRFGPAASAYWSIATTVISTGSVNSMHDSAMPVSNLMQLLAMMTNAFYGGCGVGWLNYFIFIILAVFISGLMVGRTPEFLGRKIEAREMKIAVLTALVTPFLILVGTALAAYNLYLHPDHGWLNSPGFHGFSEMLYEYTSATANNGSGLEGLGDNTPWWNWSTSVALLLGRYLPIIGPMAIAGMLAGKKYIPEGAGTLRTDTVTFGVMVLAVIILITALAFFPALALGPLAEHFSF